MHTDYKKYIKRKKTIRQRRNKKRKLRKKMKGIELYFKKDIKTYQDKGIIIFDFKDTKLDEFIRSCIVPFRRSYVSDENLNFEVDNDINIREDAIANRLPTNPSLQSGEFGEILMFFLACTVIYPDANITPIKWQWKENRDTPCHLTDIFLLKRMDKDIHSPKDYVCSIEVKSRATTPRSGESVMTTAIEGAIKDKDSRIGKMIAYLKTKYANDRKADKAKLVKRFDDATVHYERYFNAAIVVEREYMQSHIDNTAPDKLTTAQTENIALFTVPLGEMKQIYKTLYSKIPTEG
jgi:hypothetical protein